MYMYAAMNSVGINLRFIGRGGREVDRDREHAHEVENKKKGVGKNLEGKECGRN